MSAVLCSIRSILSLEATQQIALANKIRHAGPKPIQTMTGAKDFSAVSGADNVVLVQSFCIESRRPWDLRARLLSLSQTYKLA